MHRRKGQVAIFLLFAIVILIASLFLTYIKSNSDEGVYISNSNTYLSYNEIRSHIESCMKFTAEEGIMYNSFQAGYYTLPEKSTSDAYFQTAYYYYNRMITIPSLEFIQQELADYINDNLNFCILDLMVKYPQYIISAQRPDASVLFAKDSILLKADYMVTVSTAKSTLEISNFAATLPGIRIREVYSAVSEYMGYQVAEPSLICTSCLVDIGEKYDLYFDLERLNETTVIFTVTDYNSTIQGEPLSFVFAENFERYSCTNSSIGKEEAFFIDCKSS